ncbi:hypothetical protein Pelo_3703 [Pelomyxa schiedti]|nr:hypothetical protein Pelo_3703 [Pelomyxa schiedti]
MASALAVVTWEEDEFWEQIAVSDGYTLDAIEFLESCTDKQERGLLQKAFVSSAVLLTPPPTKTIAPLAVSRVIEEQMAIVMPALMMEYHRLGGEEMIKIPRLMGKLQETMAEKASLARNYQMKQGDQSTYKKQHLEADACCRTCEQNLVKLRKDKAIKTAHLDKVTHSLQTTRAQIAEKEKIVASLQNNSPTVAHRVNDTEPSTKHGEDPKPTAPAPPQGKPSTSAEPASKSGVKGKIQMFQSATCNPPPKAVGPNQRAPASRPSTSLTVARASYFQDVTRSQLSDALCSLEQFKKTQQSCIASVELAKKEVEAKEKEIEQQLLEATKARTVAENALNDSKAGSFQLLHREQQMEEYTQKEKALIVQVNEQVQQQGEMVAGLPGSHPDRIEFERQKALWETFCKNNNFL